MMIESLESARKRSPFGRRAFTGFLLTAVMVLAPFADAQQKPGKSKKFGYDAEPISLGSPGKPDFLTGPNSGTPRGIALGFAKQNTAALDVSDEDLDDLKLMDEYTSEHNGVTHMYFRQQIDGIDVVDTDLSAHVTRKGEVAAMSSSLLKGLRGKANRGNSTLAPAAAIAAAAAHLELTLTEPLVVIEAEGGADRRTTFTTGGISTDPIVTRLVFQPVSKNRVRLAWSVEIQELSGQHWWNITVDAHNAEVLAGLDYGDHDDWGATFVPDTTRNSFAARAATTSTFIGPPATVNDGSAYNVFALPLENPNDGMSSWVTSPADALASPYGWHDTNGVAGAEYTVTRGNNVWAYTDIAGSNPTNPTTHVNGGSALQFNFPLNQADSPATAGNRSAAVVNLFYWNNIIHDVYYRYGFTEAAGNFQVNNYGRGGSANDYVRAEAQDGSGTNNANFFTPADGQIPRMQMYVWSYPFSNVVIVHAPSPIAGTFAASSAVFGPAVTAAGRTGDVIVGLDAANTAGPTTTDGCSALTNAALIPGKIVILDRGTCPFSDKVKNAQNAGAIAVIIANNAPGDPIILGGADNTVTIPSVMISLEDADLYRANLPFIATLSINPNPPVNRDSDFDAGVIAHEYGHGISNRLTGGRTTVSCLGNAEQMGEGWSDFLGLVLTTSPADTATTRRGVGTYLGFQAPDGNGIRPTPYSTDMSVNPSTYDSLKNTTAISQPHGIGYVWATMLWEMYWNLVHKHGYNANVYAPWNAGGNNLAIQLVMDGMKLQPCSPGFVTGRDAILLADRNLTGGENQLEIWQAFAKRGLGHGASQGSSNNRTDGVQSFNMPPGYSPTTLVVDAAAGECSGSSTFSATLTRGVTPLSGKSITFTLNGGSFPGSVATTNSSGVATVSGVSLAGLGSGTFTIGASFAGDTTLTTGGLPSSGTASLVVSDTTDPVIDCPVSVVTVTDPGSATAVVHFTATAIDSCSPVTVTTSHPSGYAFPVGTTTVTVTATDATGNAAFCSFNVSVGDDQAPLLALPAPIVTEFTSASGAIVTFVATATDNASTVSPICSPASGSMFPIGTTTVNCSATDAAGNTTSGAFTVTVTGAHRAMSNVLAGLGGISSPSIDPKALARAIADLNEALTPSFWIDDLHVTSADGDRVFQSSKNGVNVLTNIMRNNPVATTLLQELTDRVTASMRLLASIAITEAAGGNATFIANALEALGRGDAFVAAGNHEAGIEQYRLAWSFGIRAKL